MPRRVRRCIKAERYRELVIYARASECKFSFNNFELQLTKRRGCLRKINKILSSKINRE